MEKAKILIVDTDIGLKEYYSEFLKTEEYEIRTATSADAALKLMATTPPHLVIVDIVAVKDALKISELVQKFSCLFICASVFKNIGSLEVPKPARILNKPFKDLDIKIAVRSILAKIGK